MSCNISNRTTVSIDDNQNISVVTIGTAPQVAGVVTVNGLAGIIPLIAGSNMTITNIGNGIRFDTTGGGGGSPGGSSGQVQYNNAGSFGGLTGITTSAGALQTLTATGAIQANGAIITNLGAGGLVKALSTAGLLAIAVPGTDYMVGSNNLSELTNFTTALTNLAPGLNGQAFYGTVDPANDALWVYSGSLSAGRKTASANIFASGHGLTQKTPIGADEIVILDSTSSFSAKKALISALPFQVPITLTTTGTSGAATFSSGTLNIPNYANTTYNAGTGLTLTSTTFSVNTSQNITTLSNLTVAGLIQTTSGGVLSSALLTSGQVTTALGFTPYNATNPSAYISNITGLITAGTNITITGSGTSASPYNITASSSAGSAFNTITSGTNTTAAMIVGTGASLAVSGSGTIAATSAPASGLTGATLASGVTASSLTSVGTLAALTVTATITGSVSGNAGTATKWATARNLAGNSVDGSANVAFANKFIVQGTTDAGLSGAQFLGALATGIVKNTTTTGVLSIATAGTDYQAPITLTTTGTSGAATFTSNTLNIPQYAGTTYTADGVTLTLTGTVFSINTTYAATLATLTGTQTLTNKTITKKSPAYTNATSLTPNSDTSDIVYQANTQATGTLTINADAGTSQTRGKAILFMISSTNVQTFAWNAQYVGGTVPLPTATTGGGKTDLFPFFWSDIVSKWYFTGQATGF